MGLFVMVGALVKTGVIGQVSRALADATAGKPLVAVLALLVVSGVLSAIVDNIPYVATMAPIVSDIVQSQAPGPQTSALWWSLALGADLGGNATAVGASANVVALGLAARNGTPISFWEFTRYGTLVAAVSLLLAGPYLWLRYFVLA